MNRGSRLDAVVLIVSEFVGVVVRGVDVNVNGEQVDKREL